MHDYEYAVTQHHIGCRLARRVMFPDTVPASSACAASASAPRSSSPTRA